MKRKIVTILLMIALICWMAVPAQAVALEFVVTGATVMTMALMGTIGLMAINGAGFSDALVTAAENAGQNAKSFAQDLFASYARSQNITAGQAVQLGQQGIKYTEDGLLLLNESVSNLYSGFVKWAFDADGGPNLSQYVPLVESGVSVTVPPEGFDFYWTSLGITFPCPIVSFAAGTNIFYTAGGAVTYPQHSVERQMVLSNAVQSFTISDISNPSKGYYETIFFDENPFTLNGSAASQYVKDSKSVYWATAGRLSLTGNSWTNPDYDSIIARSSNTSGKPGASSSSDIRGPACWGLLYGTRTSGEATYEGVDTNVLDGLDVENGQDINILDPSDIVTAPDTNVTGGVIDVQAWLDMLADVIATGQADIALEVDGAIEDVSVTAAEEDIAVETAGSESISGAGEIANSTSVDGLDQYTLELVDFFPFCIPFDIYDMLSLFAAQREAPSFDWRFYVPNVVDETIEIDLSPFDPVAQVLRTVELIAAAIGLAFVTKKLIQGGD